MNEQRNQNNNVNPMITIALLIILVVVVCGFGIYYVVDNHNVKMEENNNATSTENVNTTTIMPEDVRNQLMEYSKEYIYLNYLGKNIKSVDELTDIEIFLLVAYTVGFKDGVQNAIKKSVKIDRKIDSAKIEEFKCPVDGLKLYNYDANTDIPTIAEGHGHGAAIDVTTWILSNRYVEATIEDDTYVIKVKQLFREDCQDGCGPSMNFYGEYPRKNVNPIFSYKDVQSDTEPEDIAEYKIISYFNSYNGKIPTYVYKFVKEGEDYKLTAYSMEK